MKAKEIIDKEDRMMVNIRELIPKIVGIRLEAQKAASWINKYDAELATALEEMSEAIDALYRAETAMGNAHQNLLVSQATLQTTIKDTKKAES